MANNANANAPGSESPGRGKSAVIPPDFEAGRTPVSEGDFWNKYEVKYYDDSIPEQILGNVKGFRPFPTNKKDWARWGRKRLPLVAWLPGYDRQSFLADLIAAVTVAVLNIPQGISYALLAGVPPQNGLYTSIFPGLAYAIFGTSRQISIGTFALVALMTAQAAEGIVGEGSIDGSATNIRPEYIDATVAICFTVGIVELLMGFLRLSVVTLFLSDALLSGFTCGAAFHVATSQLQQLSGIKSPSYDNPGGIFQKWIWYLKEIPNWDPADAVCGLISVIILLVIRQINIKYKAKFPMPIPGELIVTALAIIITFLADLGEKVGLSLLGEVPSGLPTPSIPSFEAGFGSMLVASIPIAIVSYVISISIVKTFGKKHQYHTSSGQELYALGAASIFGSLFQSFPPSGSLSRSAVGNEAGQKTQIASVLQGGILVLVVLFMTPAFAYLPNSVLGGIILVALRGLLLQVYDARDYAKIKAADFYVWLISFVATLIFNVTIGVVIALAANLSVIIIRTSRPSIQLLGWIPNTEIYRDKERVEDAVDIEGVILMRFNASIYYSNARFLQDRVMAAVRSSDQDHIHSFILDCNPINDIDTAGVKMLLELRRDLKKENVTLYLAMAKAAVRDVLKRGGYYDDEGTKYLFVSLHDAIVFAVHGGHHHQSPHEQADALQPENINDDGITTSELADGADIAINMMNANLNDDDDDDEEENGKNSARLRRRATNDKPTSDGTTTGLPYFSRLDSGENLELPVFNTNETTGVDPDEESPAQKAAALEFNRLYKGN